MNRTVLVALIGTLGALLSGCITYESRGTVEPVFSNPRPVWTIGEETSATVGDLVLAEGAEIRSGPAYELLQPLNFTLPGTMGISFSCAIDPCVLEPRGMVGNQVLFAAPAGAAAADFNGRSVFVPDDELGIRVDRKTSAMLLYCDNSRFNNTIPGFAVWKRSATPQERAAFRLTSCERLFWLPRSAALRYSGSSSGEVRFTFTRYEFSDWEGVLVERDSTEFRFDVPDGGRGEIAVRGALIELVSITPTELRYIVKRGFGPPGNATSDPAPRREPVGGSVAMADR
jgi:hypothetical protein